MCLDPCISFADRFLTGALCVRECKKHRTIKVTTLGLVGRRTVTDFRTTNQVHLLKDNIEYQGSVRI